MTSLYHILVHVLRKGICIRSMQCPNVKQYRHTSMHRMSSVRPVPLLDDQVDCSRSTPLIALALAHHCFVSCHLGPEYGTATLASAAVH